VQIGEEVLRETAAKVGEAQVLSYGDEHLEAKLFPHLFPYGKGSWYWRKKMLLLLENITKCVLCMLTEDGQMIGFIHFSLLIET